MSLLADLLKQPQSWRVDKEILLEIRSSGLRESELVLEKGSKFISQDFSKLGEERWVVLEQVCLAALDCGKFNISKDCLSRLSSQFPGSARVSRLKGMQYEAEKQFHLSLKIYNELLAVDPTDVQTMKRKISVLIETGQPTKAIAALNEYLAVFMADTDAWAELGHLYLEQQMYKQAAFCYEELILAEPHNYHYFVKLAEIKYTLGGVENIQESVRYYSFALELSKESNLRAYYGLCLATSALNSLQKGLPGELVSSYVFAKEQIQKKSIEPQLPIIQQMFSTHLDFPEAV